MANPLTGDYEAVVQIAIRQINGLLGTLHQNGDQDDAPLKLMHSVTTRIGDPRPRRPDVGPFRDWVVAYQKAGPGRGLNDIRGELTSTTPPGVAKLFSEAFDVFDQDWSVQLPPDVVRGLGKLQVSTVTISVTNGSSTEITVHAQVRAKYYPDPDTTDVPQPVHGEVRAAFDIIKLAHGTGHRLLIQPSAQDAKIEFIAAPGSGLTTADASAIAFQVRKFLREGISLLPVDLPADFAFADFKGLGSGANQVIALPIQLSGTGVPAGNLQSITQSFIGSSGFGFAVSKEHVNTLIDLEAIRRALESATPSFTIDAWVTSATVTYHLRFSSGPTITFTNGAIEISGRVEAETPTSWAPNGYVSFKQRLALNLNYATQAITLDRLGDPDVDESWFIPHSRAVSIVRTQIDSALTDSRAGISGIFAGAKFKLVHGLRTFDTAAWAEYTAIDITTDGVIIRGEIKGQVRRAPVVQIAETHQGTAFTALESWIPSGRIARFAWTWVEHSGLADIWSGVVKSVDDEQSFIFPKPTGITTVSQICLRIEGTQTTAAGQELNLTGGTTCHVQEPEYALDIPSWWAPLTIPIWRPPVADDAPLRAAIGGHMSVQASSPGDLDPQRNALVYFVGKTDRPLDPLIEALKKTRSGSSVVTTVVLPAGTFDASRPEVENKLGLSHEGLPPLHFTEDDEGGWTRTFGVSKTPSIYLINARREFVWQHEGELDPAELAAALDKYADPATPSGFRPIRLAVAQGDAAPDAFFEDSGNQYALHRLKGRNVLLNFWQSWSAPCLSELQRLQDLSRGKEAPFIVAFHGGSDTKAVDAVRKRFGITYPLTQDPQQRMARTYGVRCWPTTISIDAEGHVDHVQFGTDHEHDHPPDKSAE